MSKDMTGAQPSPALPSAEQVEHIARAARIAMLAGWMLISGGCGAAIALARRAAEQLAPPADVVELHERRRDRTPLDDDQGAG